MSDLQARDVEWHHSSLPNVRFVSIRHQMEAEERDNPCGRVWLVPDLSYWRPEGKQLYYTFTNDRREEVREYDAFDAN